VQYRREGFLPMFHLIYNSRACQAFSDADLKKLLMRARLNNGKINVTGMLIYHDGVFLQALEGDEPTVRDVFNRIEKDARHTGVAILRSHSSLGERRIFGDWSMGFAGGSSNARVLKGFVDLEADQDLLILNETEAMELLSSCSRIPQHEPAHL
jgi:Sensors of blue-light using FAD